MHSTRRRSIAFVLLSAGAAAAISAQSAQKPAQFRTAVQLVEVDAVVRDRQNRPVRGLTRDDFEIVEPGNPEVHRAIAAFEEIHHEPAPASPWPNTMLRDVAENGSALEDRLVVFAIDDTHVRTEYTDDLRRASRDAIARLGPGATMVLLTTSGRHRIEATNDVAVLLREAERIAGQEERYVMQPPLEIRTDGPHPLTTPPLASTQQFQSDFRITLNALGDAARALTTASAHRKALVWISNGVDQLGGQDTKFLAGLLDKMRRAHVTTYAIDPIGTKPPMPGGSYDGMKRAGKATPWDGLKQQKSGALATISRLTGGFALYNDDDIAGGIDRVANDLDNYYLLGFYPDPAPTGYQPVVVRVKPPDVTVRYREGYDLDAAASAADRAEHDPMSALGATGVPVAEFPLRLFAVALPDRPRARVPVLLAIGAELAPAATFELAAVDEDRMKVVGVWKGLANAHEITTTLALFPGRYQLRAFVTSGARKASVFAQLTVPDFSAERTPLVVSSLILGRADAPASPGGFPIPATTDRVFVPGDILRVYAAVTSKAPARARLSLLDSRDAIVFDADAPIASGRVDARLALPQLAASGYRIQLTVAAGAETARRELGIVVK